MQAVLEESINPKSLIFTMFNEFVINRDERNAKRMRNITQNCTYIFHVKIKVSFVFH